jgi:D-serine deaminase-like pyridoxal phosphate-dependent protein
MIYYNRLERNIKKMISDAGDVNFLRPHVKTHKISEIVKLQKKHGISKVKCATIAEAEMAAGSGADDILLAYQPVGPNVERFFELQRKFPGIKFSCLTDCENIILELSEIAVRTGIRTSVWLDINCGMNRTGIIPGDNSARLYQLIASSPMLVPEGLHVYDGHIHDSDLILRERNCNKAYKPVESLIDKLNLLTGGPVRIVAGGTPTFPIHAKRENVETSPGTVVLWDYGYSKSFPDMEFMHAAVLLARVISKPESQLVCIDLGTKAVASEMPHPRIKIIGLGKHEFVSHNEEHMVIKTPEAEKIKVGDIFYCIPYHICPTVARYDKVYVVRDGKMTEQWEVQARKRELTV